MSSFRSDFLAALAKTRSEQRYNRECTRAYEDGVTACLGGCERCGCTYRKGHKRNAWLRGWDDAARERDERQARASLTDDERAKGRLRIQALREQFPYLDE